MSEHQNANELLADIHVMRTRLADIIINCGNRGMEALLSHYSAIDEVFASCERMLSNVAAEATSKDKA